MAAKKNFESALQKLEEAVNQLEKGELSLDQSLGVFSVGVKHAEICREALADVELKVEKLLPQEDGSQLRERFERE